MLLRRPENGAARRLLPKPQLVKTPRLRVRFCLLPPNPAKLDTYRVRLFAPVLRLHTWSQRFDLSGGRGYRPDSPGGARQRGELQPPRFAMGETCLQLPPAHHLEPGRRSGLDAGRFLESLSESSQARRSGAVRAVVVSDRA